MRSRKRCIEHVISLKNRKGCTGDLPCLNTFLLQSIRFLLTESSDLFLRITFQSFHELFNSSCIYVEDLPRLPPRSLSARRPHFPSCTWTTTTASGTWCSWLTAWTWYSLLTAGTWFPRWTLGACWNNRSEKSSEVRMSREWTFLYPERPEHENFPAYKVIFSSKLESSKEHKTLTFKLDTCFSFLQLKGGNKVLRVNLILGHVFG